MSKPYLIIYGLIGVVVFLTILIFIGVIPGAEPRDPPPFTIVVWGFEDQPQTWEEIAQSYRKTGVRTATIAYAPKDAATYETELLNALASGTGPDIFLMRDSWIAGYGSRVRPLPEGSLGYERKNLRAAFADGIASAVVNQKGELLGTPLAFDTLALFYNRDYLNAANIPAPPQTWEEAVEYATKLTRRSEVGGLRRSGLAIGTAENTAYAPDILMALIAQSGGAILSADGTVSAIEHPKTHDALSFYTAFSDSTRKTYSWNTFFDRSIDAFARGEAAMAIGYARDVPRIVALNPQLNFDAAPLPQPKGEGNPVNFGRFNLLAVSRLSKRSTHAWNFLLWLQRKDVSKSYIDLEGVPPARRDLVTAKPPRDYLIPFYDQVLSARTIPIRGGDSLLGIVGDMITSVVNRRLTVPDATTRAGREITNLLRP